MPEMKINKLNTITTSIDVIPLNLQDNLILYEGEVVGMFHGAHMTARLFRPGNHAVEAWLTAQAYEIQYSIDTLILSQWTEKGEMTCAEIILANK